MMAAVWKVETFVLFIFKNVSTAVLREGKWNGDSFMLIWPQQADKDLMPCNADCCWICLLLFFKLYT